MGTWSKIVLSGSTAGRGIPVTGNTPSKASLLHTMVTGAADSIDEVILYAYNTVTVAREIGIRTGPTTVTGSRWVHTLPAGDLSGLQPISPGIVGNATEGVRAWVTNGASGSVIIFGWVNRYAS